MYIIYQWEIKERMYSEFNVEVKNLSKLIVVVELLFHLTGFQTCQLLVYFRLALCFTVIALSKFNQVVVCTAFVRYCFDY
jgi:hypothetical protein